VAVGVVDRFQPVDAHVHHGQLGPGRLPGGQLPGYLQQPALIGQPGQLRRSWRSAGSPGGPVPAAALFGCG
jgi:hypothetical protein